MRSWALLLAACASPPEAEAPRPEALGVVMEMDGGPLSALSASRVVLAADDRAEAETVSAEIPGAVPLTIRAERSTWALKTREVRFEGAVEARRGPFVLQCEALHVEADAAGKPTRALAKGSVVVRREAWTARAAEAELVLAEGKVTLTGSPSIGDGQSELRGERVVLWMDDERVECDRCTLSVPDPLVTGRP